MKIAVFFRSRSGKNGSKTALLRYMSMERSFMRTGLHKRDKTTEIFFDEANPMVEIHTHNTDLKRRLTAYAEQYPDQCKQTDEDAEIGYKSFIIAKGRFSVRLNAPYSEERRKAASERATKSNLVAKQRAKIDVQLLL